MKATRAKVPWEEAAWPWQAAAVLVTVDIAGLALARYAVGWGVTGTPTRTGPGPDHLMAIVGNWPIAARTLLALSFALYFTGRGVPLRAFGLAMSGFRRRGAEFGRCLGVVLPLLFAASMIVILLLRASDRGEMLSAPLHFIKVGDAGRWIWIFVVALPPFEEFTYRGVLHPVLRRHMGVGGAVAIGGLIFGLLHALYGIDLASLVAYAIGGAVLAWVYERTGSLFFPWLLHVLTNLAGVWISSYPEFFKSLGT